MTTQTDTPRTDAELNKTWKGIHAAFVPMSFAKQLERELIELQQQKRNCLEIIDDEAKEKAELKAEVERLKSQLTQALEIADAMYDSGKAKPPIETLWLEQKEALAALKEEIK
jgi:predicted nuclease with TOPRIM domain